MSDSIFSDALATACSADQGKFLNQFVRHLKMLCADKLDMQLCYISYELDSNSRSFFLELAKYIELAAESRARVESSNDELRRTKSELENQVRDLRLALAEIEP